MPIKAIKIKNVRTDVTNGENISLVQSKHNYIFFINLLRLYFCNFPVTVVDTLDYRYYNREMYKKGQLFETNFYRLPALANIKF